MIERTGITAVHGNPLTLLGREVAVGEKAPDCAASDNDLKPVRLSSFAGKVVILSFVPSLDTPTCDMETRRFNIEAASLGSDVAIVTVSMDLPFAQKRWCGAAGVERVITLSDYKDRCMGEHFGVLIKENGLTARAVFVIDKSGVVRYVQIVPDLSREPDYAPIMAQARGLI